MGKALRNKKTKIFENQLAGIHGLSHLKKVSKQFAAGDISEEVMKLWLDRGLQYDIRMGKQIYNGIVLQEYDSKREEDDKYIKAISGHIDDYFKRLQGGVVTIQNSDMSYIRAQDEGKVDDKNTLVLIKKIFRQLCFLNGVNPENMAGIDSRSIFG